MNKSKSLREMLDGFDEPRLDPVSFKGGQTFRPGFGTTTK